MALRALPRSGAGGHQPKTTEGHITAIRHFNEFIDFARFKNIGVGQDETFKSFQDWTAEDFSQELVYQQFAFYLSHEAVKNVVGQKKRGRYR